MIIGISNGTSKTQQVLQRIVRTAALVAASVLLVSACAKPSAPDLPHEPHPVIIVDIDTLRASQLGCYGYERDTSPNIDRFATEAVQFAWAFSQAPNTGPSQSSILSGLYPSTHGNIGDEDRLSPEVVTMAEVFRDHGYTTAAFIDGGYMSALWGVDQGFDLYEDNRGGGLRVIGPKVKSWLDEHYQENFLLLLHTYDVHSPYDPPEPFRSAFLAGLAPHSPDFEPTVEQLEAIRTSVWTDEPKSLSPADVAYAKARYDGGILYVDDWFAGFLEHLRELGLLDRATVVLISDHGEEFQEHGSVLHEKLYATVTHIPLIIRLPGGRHPGVVEEAVESIDLMPTLLDLTGLAAPTVQGESLLPLLDGRTSTRSLAFGESPFFGQRSFVTTSRYRLLHTAKTDQVELYEYRQDPDEQHDLAAELPDVAERLRAALHHWQRMIQQSERHHSSVERMDEQLRQQLESLGYI